MFCLAFNNFKFPGVLSSGKTLFVDGMDEKYQPSKYALDRYNRGQGVRTMDLLYETLVNYKSGNVFVGVNAKNSSFSTMKIVIDGVENTLINTIYSWGDKLLVKAAIVSPAGIWQGIPVYTSENNLKIKEGIMLALLPFVFSEQEAKETYDKLSGYLDRSPAVQSVWLQSDIEEFARLINKLSSNIESRLVYHAIPVEPVLVDIEKIPQLRKDALLKEGIISHVYCGTEPEDIFAQAQVSTEVKKAEQDEEDFEGKYKYNPERILEPDAIIATVPKGYVMPDYVPEICKYLKGSTNFAAPVRVVYLIGPAGTGKSVSSKVIAAGTGQPIDHYTCNPGTEIFDFLGQVFPVNGSTVTFLDALKELHLPNTDDIVNDPSSAYTQMYSTSPERTPDEGALILEMMKRVTKYMTSHQGGFRYVESGLIKAIRLGYAFEIQEIGAVLRPGVAVGLNALLESGGDPYIQLPTGEVVKKHPDCTIIFTSNDEYEGTCNLNQSVLDRMALVYRIDNPPKQVMKERILARLKFPDEGILDRMIEVIYEIEQASKEKEITDGVCGYRSLENWCMCTMILADGNAITDAMVYKTGITCVMNKTSQKREYVDELMSCLTVQFAAPNLV